MRKNKKNEGFTLIELLVTVTVFSILMTIVGGIFTQALNLQRRAFMLQVLEENGRFSLETMAREIRFSEISNLPTNCPMSVSGTLNLKHPVNGNIEYKLENGAIHRIVEGVDSVITSDEVEITKLDFCIMGTNKNDDKQPRITVLLTIKTGEQNAQELDLQTTITPRFLVN